MRRVMLDLLRCPRCRSSGLTPESDTAEVLFGPVHCAACHARYPVGEGVVDLMVEANPPRGVQRSFEKPLVARSYERYVRPAAQLAVSGRKLDEHSELVMYRSLIGSPDGPLLDLGCGTAMFSRKLAREPGMPPIVAMDVSRAMLEEAMAQTREEGSSLDFVRSEAPELPFQDCSLGAVLQTGSLHLIQDASRLFLEIARALRPGGRYVASTYAKPRKFASLHRKAGLYPRSEDELRRGLAAAGFESFERLVLPPFIVVRAEKAAEAGRRAAGAR